MSEQQVAVSARVVRAAGKRCAVELVELPGCGGCANSGMCGSSERPAVHKLELDACTAGSVRMTVGTEVTLAVPAPQLLRVALIIYLLPAVLLLLGAALGNMVVTGQGEVGGVSGALGGLLLGWACIRLYDSRCGGYRWSGRVSAYGLTLGLVRRAS